MESDLRVIQLINVVLYVLRIGGDNWAVVVVNRVRKLFPLVGDAGIEDIFDTLFDQP